jgi:hypothetical protein
MSGLEKLINFLAREYYASLLVGLFELTAIITGLLFAPKSRIVIFFLFYLILDFVFFLCDIYLKVFSSFTPEQAYIFVLLTNGVISLVELLTYFYFFSHVIKNKTTITFMKILAILFFIITVLLEVTQFTFLTSRLTYTVELAGAIEFLSLVPPCLVYYYELLKNDPIANLYQHPSFWIVTGILFYSVNSIPYLLIDRFVYDNQYEHRYLLDLAFFYIPFSLNFIFLTRAFLCKKTLTI